MLDTQMPNAARRCASLLWPQISSLVWRFSLIIDGVRGSLGERGKGVKH
jgi:hypothetical protein